MSIKHVILGFLSEAPLTGYDLKKKFLDSEIFHWSGNNNQIYRTLVELHDEGLVTVDVQYQENKPPRKIYTINEQGLTVLRQWLSATPELPQFRNPLLMQLVWADQLAPHQLSAMLAKYEESLQEHILMQREKNRRNHDLSRLRSTAERIAQHVLSFYELERDWVHTLRQELDPQ